jgi:MinD superfamily P-loop ATPase
VHQLTVLSGKGGTGKTSLVASFATFSPSMVVTDCDVDAPDLHLLLHPKILQTQDFQGAHLAEIDATRCTQCGRCETACRFDAIQRYCVDPVLCEGCGVCTVVCPADAVTLTDRIAGYAFISTTRYGPMAHARLNPGEENSGKLVTRVRRNARQIADTQRIDLILNDGPPGIGCPVIAAVGGVDAGLVVVEPTLTGIHDMERTLRLLDHFHIPALVCINKYDINTTHTDRITAFCKGAGIDVVGQIPFDPLVTHAMIVGKPVVEYAPTSDVTEAITTLWRQTLTTLHHTGVTEH